MARPGGNPELVRHQFTTNREEPLIAKLSLRVTPSMLSAIKGQENWQEFVRKALADALHYRSETTRQTNS